LLKQQHHKDQPYAKTNSIVFEPPEKIIHECVGMKYRL
jgi:hypothetical protein